MAHFAYSGFKTDNPDHKTKKKDMEKTMIVDEHEYVILLPSGTQDVQWSKSQEKFKSVYDKLRETHADKLTGGINLPELPMAEGDDDKLTPHIRAIRLAFEATGEGWGSGSGCKFWYKNLYHDFPLFLNIKPTSGNIVRAKKRKLAACEKEEAVEEAPTEEEAPVEKISAQQESSKPAPKPSVSKRGPNTDAMGRISVDFIHHEKENYAMERGVNRIFFIKDWKQHDSTPKTHYPTQIGHIEGDNIPPPGEKIPNSISVLDGSKQRAFEFVDRFGDNVRAGMFIYPIKEQYKFVITKSKEDFEKEQREAAHQEFMSTLKPVMYKGKELLYGPYDRGEFPIYDPNFNEPGNLQLIGDYQTRNENDTPTYIEGIDDNDDKWVIQATGYSSSEEEEEEVVQEIPKEWQKQFSRSKKLPDGTPRPYWVNINDPNYNNPDPNIKGESTWYEPPEVKAEREQQEKFDRDYEERQRKQKESEEKREAERKRIDDNRNNRGNVLRERMRKKRHEQNEKKGGKRKTRRRKNAGSGKGTPGTKKSKSVSFGTGNQNNSLHHKLYKLSQITNNEKRANKYLNMAQDRMERGPDRPIITQVRYFRKDNPPTDTERVNDNKKTSTGYGILRNRTPPYPPGVKTRTPKGGKRKTKRRKNNKKKKRTIKRRK
jgi:hypothetical protein